MAFFGDGAVNNGAFHEGINLAAAWDLPVVFVCENNLYATEIPFATVTKNPSVARTRPGLWPARGSRGWQRCDGGLPGRRRSRAARTFGGGPTLLECKTYRTRAHAEGMRDAGYRTLEEIATWKARCPIKLFEDRLLAE